MKTRLTDVWREHRAPHLVTVAGDGAHVVPVTVELDGDAFRVAAPGRRTRAAVAGNPAVTLVWSPVDDGGYSLLVDGTATDDGAALTVRPSRAVRHRPGSGDAGAARPGCGADCVELDPSLP